MRFNPGHLEALHHLGIIGEDEHDLTASTLAERVIHSPQMGNALDIIRQEALNVTMALDVVMQTIDDLEALFPDLNTRQAILDELAGLGEEIAQLPAIAPQLTEVRAFVKIFRAIATEEKITFSAVAQTHLAALVKLEVQAGQIAGQIDAYILKGQAVLQALVKKLNSL